MKGKDREDHWEGEKLGVGEVSHKEKLEIQSKHPTALGAQIYMTDHFA